MGKVSTRQKIRSMLNSNPLLNTGTIMQKTGATRSLVHQVRRLMKKNLKQETKAVQKQETKAVQKQKTKAAPKQEPKAAPKQEPKAAPKQEPKANQVQVGGYHYRNKTIQPWDAIHAWDLDFFSGNVVKYVARHREKNGVQDLKKARHYLDKLIELMEKGQ